MDILRRSDDLNETEKLIKKWIETNDLSESQMRKAIEVLQNKRRELRSPELSDKGNFKVSQDWARSFFIKDDKGVREVESIKTNSDGEKVVECMASEYREDIEAKEYEKNTQVKANEEWNDNS